MVGTKQTILCTSRTVETEANTTIDHYIDDQTMQHHGLCLSTILKCVLEQLKRLQQGRTEEHFNFVQLLHSV